MIWYIVFVRCFCTSSASVQSETRKQREKWLRLAWAPSSRPSAPSLNMTRSSLVSIEEAWVWPERPSPGLLLRHVAMPVGRHTPFTVYRQPPKLATAQAGASQRRALWHNSGLQTWRPSKRWRYTETWHLAFAQWQRDALPSSLAHEAWYHSLTAVLHFGVFTRPEKNSNSNEITSWI